MGLGQDRGERLARDFRQDFPRVIAQAVHSVTVDISTACRNTSRWCNVSTMNGHPVTPMCGSWNEPGIIGKVLDGGAYGVICPMINTSRKRRHGCLSSIRRGHALERPDSFRHVRSAGTYQQTANDEIVLLPMMETRPPSKTWNRSSMSKASTASISPVRSGLLYGLVQNSIRDEPEISKIYEKIVRSAATRGSIPASTAAAPTARCARSNGLQARDAVERSGLMMTYAKMQSRRPARTQAAKREVRRE